MYRLSWGSCIGSRVLCTAYKVMSVVLEVVMNLVQLASS